jgi:tetratricopeptide (TPR) repeat protein
MLRPLVLSSLILTTFVAAPVVRAGDDKSGDAAGAEEDEEDLPGSDRRGATPPGGPIVEKPGDGKKANDDADGKKADAKKADGKKADPKKAEGKKADGKNADGKNADGTAADDESFDDILAPTRPDGERGPVTVPMKERALKVGLLPLVPIGEAQKPLADSLSSELLKAFNESASVETVALGLDAPGAAGTVDVGAATAAKKSADDKLARARSLLAKLQFGKAKKAFEDALATYEKAASQLDTPQPLIDAWTGLAEVAARQAQDDEVRRCFAAVVALNPEYELDKRFPGLFRTTHRKVRDQLLKGKRAKVFVDESGAGAAVTIDGRPAKSAPARVAGLLPGPHLVRALREGLAPWGAVVVVEGDAEATVSPGFLVRGRRGPAEDLAQNRLSAEAAAVVAEAARKQSLKAGLVGVVTKDAGRALVQLVYVDAASGKVAQLPTTGFSPSLLDVGIEALKARARMEELAAADAPALADADAEEALVEGARAGAAVTVAEVEFKYNVKISKDTPASRAVSGGDDDEERATASDDDGDGERAVTESKGGSRKTLDNDDPYAANSDDAVVDEDSLTAQPWFVPTMVVVGVVGAGVLLGGTGAALIGFGVLPDPRPADGAEVSVTLPAP